MSTTDSQIQEDNTPTVIEDNTPATTAISTTVTLRATKILCSANEPNNKSPNKFWYDTVNNKLKRYNATTSQWEAVGMDASSVKVEVNGTTYDLNDYLKDNVVHIEGDESIFGTKTFDTHLLDYSYYKNIIDNKSLRIEAWTKGNAILDQNTGSSYFKPSKVEDIVTISTDRIKIKDYYSHSYYGIDSFGYITGNYAEIGSILTSALDVIDYCNIKGQLSCSDNIYTNNAIFASGYIESRGSYIQTGNTVLDGSSDNSYTLLYSTNSSTLGVCGNLTTSDGEGPSYAGKLIVTKQNATNSQVPSLKDGTAIEVYSQTEVDELLGKSPNKPIYAKYTSTAADTMVQLNSDTTYANIPGKIFINPTISNTGPVFLAESTTAPTTSNAFPIYPDQTYDPIPFTNLNDVYVGTEVLGESFNYIITFGYAPGKLEDMQVVNVYGTDEPVYKVIVNEDGYLQEKLLTQAEYDEFISQQ